MHTLTTPIPTTLILTIHTLATRLQVRMLWSMPSRPAYSEYMPIRTLRIFSFLDLDRNLDYVPTGRVRRQP